MGLPKSAAFFHIWKFGKGGSGVQVVSVMRISPFGYSKS
jgi:hypothetical protein